MVSVRYLWGAVAAASLIAIPTAMPAQTVIDFEDLACAGSGGQTFPSYTFATFVFTSDNPIGVNNFCTGHANYPGSTALFNNAAGGTTTLSQIGGGAFSLLSIKLAQLSAGMRPGHSVTFAAALSGGGVTSQTFAIPANNGSPVLSQFAFNPSFANVVSVSWTQGFPGGDLHQFDDVTVSATVPEPTSLVLTATGLVAVCLYRRRKRRR
jgi:hypothetical protein